MKKKSNFEKKYPLFVKYITDEVVQANMLANKDLLARCEENFESIGTLIFELERHFESETIKTIISETVLKYPSSLLKSFITAYLNSDEATKANDQVVMFFNKTLHLGNDCLHYIEKHGIIANRLYKELPHIVIDAMYMELKTGNETYKEEKLDNIYSSLSYGARAFVVGFLEEKNFDILDKVFERFNYQLSTIINLLMSKSIDHNILNHTVCTGIGEYRLMILCLTLLELEDFKITINNIKKLIAMKRISLLRYLIDSDVVLTLGALNSEELENMSDDEILVTSQEKKNILERKED